MSLELTQLYPNARITHDGSDATVSDVNASTVKLVRDDGKVEEYTYDSVLENASVYEPPEDVPAPEPTQVNPGVPVPIAPQPEAPPEAQPTQPAPQVVQPEAQPAQPEAQPAQPEAQPAQPQAQAEAPGAVSPAGDSRQQTN